MTRILFALLIALFTHPAAAQVLGEPMDTYVAEQEAAMDARFRIGDFAGAEAILRPLIAKATEAGGPTHVKVLRLRQALSNTMRLQGRNAEALQEMEDAYKIWTENYPKFNPYRLDASMQLAVHLSRMGYSNDALPLALEATKFAETMWGPKNQTTLLWQFNTAGIFKDLGYWDEALASVTDLLPKLDAVGNDRTAYYACSVAKEKARILRDLGRLDEAAEAYADTLRRMQGYYVPHHPETVYTQGEYALVLYKTGDFDGMARVMEDWHEGLMTTFSDTSLPYAEYLAYRAFMKAQGTVGTPAFDAAVQDMRASVALREQLLSPTSEFVGKAYLDLAAMENDRQNYAEAWRLALKAEAAGMNSRMVLMENLMLARNQGQIPEDEVLPQAFRLSQENGNGAARAAYAMLAQRVQIADASKTTKMRDFTDMQRRQSALQQEISYYAGLPNAERNPSLERQIRAEIEALSTQINDLGAELRKQDLPFASMYETSPLTLPEVQAMLGADEALVIFDIGELENDWDYVLVVTHDTAVWREMPVSKDNLAMAVSELRDSIDLRMGVRAGVSLKKKDTPKRDDYNLYAAHWIYDNTFGTVADLLDGKTHIYAELRGALSSIPPQLLVRNDTTDIAQADWLVRHHAITVIPSIDSLRLTTLTRQTARAAHPFLGFADPVFTGTGEQLAAAGTRAALRGALAPLPETAIEVRAVAEAVGAPADQAVRAQSAASEAEIKAQDLSDYRVLYFATHGLVAGDMVTADQQLDEPALALTAGQGEDGLLTASEIASLRLNADWVVLSACNTAVGDEPGAEALSGLAEAFTYAGARALMVSHWPVESRSAVALMTDLFARRAADPTLTAARAQQQAILAMIDDPRRPEWHHPAFWAPFILVGNPD
ncbi:CHAT domain-containing protein [Thalassobius vesicularis]|uniref:CHAT domain-containing protein n=1 Tax=Thalassobius vesicularis TaxID=1294297 RepID=A0A4S3MBT3_9RHOB|nr:CHAT domain-containing tetratricopeptide repeat protein [Thalassobius vesicularis]THD74815.1 CHAT domain-containing protein [Thalassobius vesicularis]